MAPLYFTIFFLLAGFVLPDMATAFQPHAYSGLYIHQLAHLFLIFSLFIFAVNAQQTRLVSIKAWRYILAGAWVFILWNSATMIGHFLELEINEDSMFLPPGGGIPLLRLDGWTEALFYILKLDHFIAVPAMYFFYRGLKLLREGQTKPSSPGHDRP